MPHSRLSTSAQITQAVVCGCGATLQAMHNQHCDVHTVNCDECCSLAVVVEIVQDAA